MNAYFIEFASSKTKNRGVGEREKERGNGFRVNIVKAGRHAQDAVK